MKLLKYLPIALLAVAATACTEDGPNPNDIAPGVYFAKVNPKSYKISPLVVSDTIDVKVCRTFETVGTQVNFEYSIEKEITEEDGVTKHWEAAPAAEAALFHVPSTVTYTNNYSMVAAKVIVENDKLEPKQRYRINMSMAKDTQVSLYGSGTYSFTYYKSKDAWVDCGNALYTDGWVLAAYKTESGPINVAQAPYEVPMQENKGEPGHYRLVNPYSAAFTSYKLPNTYTGTEDCYMEIDVTDPSFPMVMPSEVGYTFKGYDTVIACNQEGWYVDGGSSIEEAIAEIPAEERSTYANGVLNVPVPITIMGAEVFAFGQAGVIAFPDSPAAAALKAMMADQKAKTVGPAIFTGKTFKR